MGVRAHGGLHDRVVSVFSPRPAAVVNGDGSSSKSTGLMARASLDGLLCSRVCRNTFADADRQSKTAERPLPGPAGILAYWLRAVRRNHALCGLFRGKVTSFWLITGDAT